MSHNEFERDVLLTSLNKFHQNEHNKFNSRYLRGTIKPSLSDAITGSMPENDTLLLKFHGIYQQDNREERAQRKRRKLEPDYQFMVRLRIPGGRCTKAQWLGLDKISRQYAERGLRITTRQTIQLHGVRKPFLAACVKAIGDIGLDTIAACGDDSRGVVCGVHTSLSQIQAQVETLTRNTSQTLIPKTHAYPEIWYDQPSQAIDAQEDPLYGPLYLPRKFKVGFAIPPINDIDVYGQDLGFIAIIEQQQLIGFNVCVGGGMGQLDNRADSYPKVAEQIGFIEADEAPEFARLVMGIQRDYGNRIDRHRARFKYTLDEKGMPWFIELLAKRRGKSLLPARPFVFTQNGDVFDWQQADNKTWSLTLHVESGRVIDQLQDQLKQLVEKFNGNIRLTTNQNISLTDIHDADKPVVMELLNQLELAHRIHPEIQVAHSISCVALPTCGLAMAESERYLPVFIEKFNQLKHKHQLAPIPITLRITGCPNGCARPYLAEIGLTGRAPGLYNLYLGGNFYGSRLNTLFATNLNEEKILQVLDELLEAFAREREPNEFFGDYLLRSKRIENQIIAVTHRSHQEA